MKRRARGLTAHAITAFSGEGWWRARGLRREADRGTDDSACCAGIDRCRPRQGGGEALCARSRQHMGGGESAGLMLVGRIVLARRAMLNLTVGGTDDPRRLAKLGRSRHPAERHQGPQQECGQQDVAGENLHRGPCLPATCREQGCPMSQPWPLRHAPQAHDACGWLCTQSSHNRSQPIVPDKYGNCRQVAEIRDQAPRFLALIGPFRERPG
jgi:hypothetical protein